MDVQNAKVPATRAYSAPTARTRRAKSQATTNGQRTKACAAALAARQAGRLARFQLLEVGISQAQLARWLAGGYLLPVLPGVYALGHTAPSQAANLWAAILYAGPGAMLSHTSAAAWRGLLGTPMEQRNIILDPVTDRIHVSTPRRARSLPGIEVHERRSCRRDLHRGMPTTTVSQTLLDLAATCKPLVVRVALAQLDYRDRLRPDALLRACRPGVAGSGALRAALARHQPAFARTRSPTEVQLILICERYEIPVPIINAPLWGYVADAYWPQAQLVAELDGVDNHRSAAQQRRDRAKELCFRRHGLWVVRYCTAQIFEQPEEVRDDLRATLAARGLGAAL
jgi:hypothetical protein